MGSFADNAIAYRARWVLPVDRPPTDGGIVTIAGDRIVAVGENTSSRPPHDLGDVALLPGLVNAHTHLELGDLKAPLGHPGMPFPAWIALVVKHRRAVAASLETNSQSLANAVVCNGLVGSHLQGVAAIGEIASVGSPAAPLASNYRKVETTVFLELLGLAPERQADLLSAAQQHLAQEHRPCVQNGLSPHAPYTVDPQLLTNVCQLSLRAKCPVAMHLAESVDELELLALHTGPFAELLQSLNAWHPKVLPRGVRPLDYLKTLATAHHALVIHGNYLAADEIEFLAMHRERMSLVYCPRTHTYFGHEPYPLAQMLAAGVRVAVGTDSRASNPDLNLFEELRHIARHHPSVARADILRMGTLAGAEALGLADQFGSITPGKSARLAVVPLANDGASPYEGLFTSAPGSVRPLERSLA